MDKLVEAESKVAEHEYKLSELKSEEIKRGLENEPKHVRKMKQAEHNLEQARRNLDVAKARFDAVKSNLASAYGRFGQAQADAVKAGVSSDEVVEISQSIEKEFESKVDAAEMNRPDWKAAAKKGSGSKGGGSGGGGPHGGGDGGGPHGGGGTGASGGSGSTPHSQATGGSHAGGTGTAERQALNLAEHQAPKLTKVIKAGGHIVKIAGFGIGLYYAQKELRQGNYGAAAWEVFGIFSDAPIAFEGTQELVRIKKEVEASGGTIDDPLWFKAMP